jgi:hypothetical protein
MSGKIQNADVKTLAELQLLGADKTELIHSDKIYSPKSDEVLETALRKNNFEATTKPTVNNDITEGYQVGSFWIDTNELFVYVCSDNTDGAAKWETFSKLEKVGGTGIKSGAVEGEIWYDDINKQVRLRNDDSNIALIDTDTAQYVWYKTIINSTLQNVIVNSASKLVSKQDTLANLTTYAASASNGEYVYATDEKKYYGIEDGTLVPMGGATVLNELEDTNLGAPNDKDLIIWDNASSKWINSKTLTSVSVSSSTFTGGTLSGTSIENPTRSDVKKDTKANLETYASTTTNGQLVHATDEKKTYQIIDGELKAVGGGVGSPFIYKIFDADDNGSGFTTVNCTMSEETTAPLFGDKSFKATFSAAGSIIFDTVSIPLGSRASSVNPVVTHEVAFTCDWNQADDTAYMIVQDTSANELGRIYIKNGRNDYSKLFNITEGITEIQIKLVSTIAGIAIVDRVVFNDQPLRNVNVVKKETITYTGYTSKNGSSYVLFKNELTNDSAELIEASNTDHTRITFKEDCYFVCSGSAILSSTSEGVIYLNLRNSLGQTDYDVNERYTNRGGITINGKAKAGDYINLTVVGTPVDVSGTNISVTATKVSDAVVVDSKDDGQVGSIVPFAMETLPSEFLECDGSAVSRTTYKTLFGKIGTTYGVGDGSTTFNLPDLRGEFIRGWDNGRGVDSGRVFGSFQDGTKHTNLDVNSSGIPLFPVGNYTSDEDELGPSVSRSYAGGVSISSSITQWYKSRPRNIALKFGIRHTAETKLYALPQSEADDIHVYIQNSGTPIVARSTDSRISTSNLTDNGVGQTTIDISSLGLTDAPNVYAKIISNSTVESVWTAEVVSASNTTIVIHTDYVTSGATNTAHIDRDFMLHIEKMGADRTGSKVFLGDVSPLQVMYVHTSTNQNDFWGPAIPDTTSFKQHGIESVSGDIFGSASSDLLNLPRGKYDLDIPVAGYGGGSWIELEVYDAVSATTLDTISRVGTSNGDVTMHSTIVPLTYTFDDNVSLRFRTRCTATGYYEYLGKIKVTKRL